MAVPFLNSITLNKNEVQDFKVYNIGTGNPTLSSGGDKGYFWTDTATSVLKWWDGSNVRTLLDSASTTIVAADLSGGAAGSLPYQLTAGDTTFLGIGTANQVLKVNSGATAPEWTAQSNLSVGTATFLAGGTAGDIPVQSAAGTTGFLNIGANGRILTSNGTTPVWSATIPSSAVSGLAASATTDTTNAANITSGLLPLARLELADGSFYVGNGSNVPTATAKNLIPISGFGAATAAVAMGNQKITGLADPVDATDAANRKYVDEVAQGLDVKASCLVATIANIDLSAPGSSIDGISLASSNRVLVKDQTDKKQNGIYVWNGAAVAMTRSLDADTVAKLVGAFTFVEQGTNADSGWVCQVDSGTIGSVDIEWTKFSQAGSYTAGNGMVLSGGVFHFAQSSAYTAGQIPFCSNSPTANSIGFSSNLFWDNGNNRLGIGTASPDYGLDLQDSQNATRVSIRNNANSQYGAGLYLRTYNGASLVSNATLFTDNVGNFSIYTGTSTDARRLTIDNSGNLGLGVTPNAQAKLDVAGNVWLSPTAAYSTAPSAYWGVNVYTNTGVQTWAGRIVAGKANATAGDVNGYLAFQTNSSTDGIAERLRIDSSGNVGIGTATPAHRLNVVRTGDGITAGIAGGTYGIRFDNGGTFSSGMSTIHGVDSTLTGSYQPIMVNGSEVRFGIAANLKMLLDASGRLGIGTATPSESLDVNGAIYVRGANALKLDNASNNYVAQIKNTGASGQSSLEFLLGSPYGTKMTLDNSGNLGLGVTPSARLHTYISDGGTNNLVEIARLQRATTGTAAVGFGQYLRFDLERGDGANEVAGFIGTKWSNATAGVTKGDLIFGGSDNGALTTAMTLNAAGSLLFSTNGTASAPTIANADDTNTGLYWPTDADTLALAVGGSDAVYIDSSRRVGIGISSSLTRTLMVAGGIELTSSTDQKLAWGISGSYLNWIECGGIAGANYMRFATGNTECLRIKSTGQINFSGLAADPTGAAGDLYYSTGNVLKMHNGTAWQQLSRKYSGALSGTGTSFTVTHNLGTRDVTVQVRKSGSTYDLVYTDVQMTTENAVTVIFASSVTGSDYTVTVIG